MEREQIELIQRCQKDDRKAQEALYRRYSDVLFSICLRYCENYQDAQDVFQDGFILAFGKIKQFRFQGSFEGWLKRLMVNHCIDHLRTRSHPGEILDDFNYGEQDHEDDAVFVIDYQSLIEMVQQLPVRYREVFNLYIFEEFSHEQISKRLGITVGTSKSNFSRAKQCLRKAILNRKTISNG